MPLRRAVLSALAQTYRVREVIVVENNSLLPDAVREVCRSIADNRVYFLSLHDNVNGSMARNFGSARATGDWIAYLDADDEWEPEHVAHCLETAKAREVDFVYGSARRFTGRTYTTWHSRELREHEDAVDFLLGWDKVAAQTSSYLVRRSCLEKVKWDERLKRHQDYAFFIDISDNYRIACNPRADYVFFAVKRKRGSAVRDLASIKRFYFTFLPRMKFFSASRYLLSIARMSFRERWGTGFLFSARELLCLCFVAPSRTVRRSLLRRNVDD